MFKQGDVVIWCGAIGVVTKIFRETVYCDFYRKEGSTYSRDMVWFYQDGRHKEYHRYASLQLADSEQTKAFRECPPVVLRGVDFG